MQAGLGTGGEGVARWADWSGRGGGRAAVWRLSLLGSHVCVHTQAAGRPRVMAGARPVADQSARSGHMWLEELVQEEV